jgi:hypothetical protein
VHASGHRVAVIVGALVVVVAVERRTLLANTGGITGLAAIADGAVIAGGPGRLVGISRTSSSSSGALFSDITDTG